MSYRHGLIPRGFALSSGLAIAVLVTSVTTAFGASKETDQAKERAARKACLSGDSDLFIATHD